MKLLKVIVPGLLAALLFSCATEKGTEVSDPVVETVVEEEKKLVEKEIEVNIYYISKETIYYGNGQIDSIKEYTYDDNYNLLKVVNSNEQGEPLETLIYRYENEMLSSESSYDFNNQLSRFITYAYNDSKQLVEESLFDGDENIQSVNSYEYDGDKLVTWKTLGPTKAPMAITNYVYNGDKLVAVEIKDAVGTIDGKILKEYQGGKLTNESVNDKDGKIEKSIEYKYEDGNLVEQISYDSKGKKSRSESYIYEGDNPYPINIKFHYKSGNVESYRDLAYISNVETRTVLVEE